MYEKEFPAPEEVLQMCGAVVKKRASSKGEVKVHCPIDDKAWFEINLAKNGAWHCFYQCSSCPGHGGGSLLDLVMLFRNCDKKTAFKILTADAPANNNVSRPRKAIAKPKIAVTNSAPDAVLNETYSAFLDMLTLSDKHKENLLARGLTEADIEAVGFKTAPQSGLDEIAKKLSSEGYTLIGVPGFYRTENGPTLVSTAEGGFFVPYRNKLGQIVALQKRHDIDLSGKTNSEAIREAKKRRYRWFTSSGVNDTGGTSAKNVPFYGIPNKSVKSNKVAYATEGGLKAAAAQSLSGGRFVAIPGVSCFSSWRQLLKELKSEGIETLVDAFDSDRATNVHVADNIKKLYDIASEEGFAMKTWAWNPEYKGVDDYLLSISKKRAVK